MGKLKGYWAVICAILLVFNCFLLIKVTNDTVSADTTYNNGNSVDSYQSTFIDLLQNDGLLLNDSRLMDISDNSSTVISELFSNDDSVLLVCRLSQFQCQSCASYALEKAINMVCKDSTRMKLVFLCEYDYRSLKIFLADHPNMSGYGVYQAPQIDLSIDVRAYPYYFTLSKNMEVHDVFLPNMDDPVRTEIYWDCISKKWK